MRSGQTAHSLPCFRALPWIWLSEWLLQASWCWFWDSPENQKRRFPGKLTVLRAVSSWHPKRIALSAGQLLHGKLSRTHRAAAAVPYINRAAARRMAAAEPDFKTDLPGVGRDLRHPAMPEPESLSCRQELHLNVWHWHHNIRVTAEWRKLCQKRRTRL